jgi:hypothetical protein
MASRAHGQAAIQFSEISEITLTRKQKGQAANYALALPTKEKNGDDTQSADA